VPPVLNKVICQSLSEIGDLIGLAARRHEPVQLTAKDRPQKLLPTPGEDAIFFGQAPRRVHGSESGRCTLKRLESLRLCLLPDAVDVVFPARGNEPLCCGLAAFVLVYTRGTDRS
jgi:hypothetical protein